MKLINNHRKLVLFCGGAILGFLVFLFIFDYHTLNPINDFFCTTGYIENDSAQHYAGWMIYRNSDWMFPLGVTENISYPFGNSIMYTDSIPLFAIFFKLLSPILPATFQYFGMYVALCFMLMGGFSALLIDLFSRNFAFSLIGSLLFSFSPVMIERAFRHTALTSHFLIIAALYYYFKSRENRNLRSFIPLFILDVISITIHPYFLPFVFAISLAYCIEWALSKKEYIKSILSLLGAIVATVFVGFLIGMFHISGGAGAYGYGTFSLNLINFINPQSIGFSEWSQFLPNFDMIVTNTHTYQLESFNYLGIGVIIAFVALFIYALAVKKHRDNLMLLFKRHLSLCAVSAVLALFAVSNVITFGTVNLLTIPLPSFLTELASIFRASGRFGWIVLYLVFIFVLYMISRLKAPKVKYLPIALAAVVFVVQFYDFSGVIGRKRDYFSGEIVGEDTQVKLPRLTHSFWDIAVEDFDTFVNLEDTAMVIPNGAIELAVKIGRNGGAMNMSFAARNSDDLLTAHRASLTAEVISGIADENTLYFTAQPEKFAPLVESGYYQMFYLHQTQFVLFRSRYTQEQLDAFIAEGNFDYWGNNG